MVFTFHMQKLVSKSLVAVFLTNNAVPVVGRCIYIYLLQTAHPSNFTRYCMFLGPDLAINSICLNFIQCPGLQIIEPQTHIQTEIPG